MTVQEGALLCGRYRLQQSVGRGGMADVYLAFDSKRQAQVAVKILREDMAEDPDFVRRFRREAEALAKLDHPNIVRFYAFEQDGLVAFIVMDYIDGTTLRRHLQERRGPLDVKELTSILRDVCSALHYAHVNGFVHRDLKPGNVMLKPDGKALLTDFGISRAVEGATLTMAAVGTPAYMSPEQIAGGRVDARSDIYSLGVLLFEMATGHRPFTGDEKGLTQTGTTTRIQEAHLRLPPPDPQSINSRLPAATSAVILRTLAKDPADRWPDVVSLRKAWETAAGVTAEQDGEAGATAKTPSRRGVLSKHPVPKVSFWPWAPLLAGVVILTAAAVLFLALHAADKGEVLAQATVQVGSIAQPPSAPSPSVLPPAANPTERIGGVVQVATQTKSVAALPQPTREAATAMSQHATPYPPAATLVPTTRPPAAIHQPTHAPEAVQEVNPGRFLSVSLQAIANASLTNGYVDPPLGDVVLAGVRFSLGQGGSVTTQAAPLPGNPQSVSLPVDAQNPEAVYLLLTGGDLFGRFEGQTVGRVRLIFADGRTHAVDLVAGQNLREWKQAGDVVSRATYSALTEVWRGGNRYDSSAAVIDMLTIAVPSELQTGALVSVEVLDLSAETVGDLDPALNVLGLSVALRLAPAAEPTLVPTLTAVPTATPVKVCPVAPGNVFQALWQQQRSRLGCAINQAAQIEAATERFERGRMIWRKSTDMIYVMYDDGDWAVYPDLSVDGAPEPGGFQPPSGLSTPVRGFGTTWRAQLGGTAARIGWATETEYALMIQFQDFEQGLMLVIDGRVHLLGENGRIWLAP